MGREAGANLTTGVQNTFIGTSAGNQSTSQNYNTFIGQPAVGGVDGGDGNNVAVGRHFVLW